MVDVGGRGESFEVGTISSRKWLPCWAQRGWHGCCQPPQPPGSAKILAAQGGAPGGASTQEAWEGDRLEPMLVLARNTLAGRAGTQQCSLP